MPLNSMLVTLERFVPEMVMVAPAFPLGVKEPIEGGLIIVNSSVLVDVPEAVVTVTFPVVAVDGTVTTI